jgi:hypothetical protein
MKNHENELTKKPFLPTLIDTIALARHAEQHDKKKGGSPIACAAILHCALAVEALANNMLQFLNVGNSLGKSLERLDTLSKIELFTLLLQKNRIDRGSTALQVLSEFIDLRNQYVHPKITTRRLHKLEGSYETVSDRRYQLLALTEPSSKWSATDAGRCVKALLNSIDQLLLDQLGMEYKSLSCMFCDRVTIEGSQGPIEPPRDWALWVEKALDYRPRFFLDHIAKRFDVDECQAQQDSVRYRRSVRHRRIAPKREN